mmetsp:Transcript_2448/g.3444  ORF Transcript_2448/g.3444 Transcript_2448/m.3444 type:complete len:407 (-) Transcript_2448:82-1302(-)|eukprot:CAMPEP_0184854844 /NCGR_PEP_ID=MMETSP0580-20130426/228_1 /TAXON_ID=1118495 /ORGANISM="Dactyliosolen fragilissimus" /LENGTH=406 /DNA_ID=CAMNT_0027349195 /DNA_START=29 /DNA_END=1249 /DNA_ORIENTATION=+
MTFPSPKATISGNAKSTTNGSNSNTEHPVIIDLKNHLLGKSSTNASESVVHNVNPNNSSNSLMNSMAPLPVAAIKSLLGVIQRTNANTMMGLQAELRDAEQLMIEFAMDEDLENGVLLGGRSHIALASGCELFMKYITRCFLEIPDFQSCIQQVLERGRIFSTISITARDRIASIGQPFIRPNSVVLTHGFSRVVSALLLEAASQANTNFEILVLEGRPDASGAKAAALFHEAGIPTTVVLDSAMAHVMERADIVIVGAEGVVENGGIINKIGTYGLAIAAKELGRPFYVAAESYKFARLFPLNQNDLPEMGRSMRHLLNFVDTACWSATGGLINGRKVTVPGHDKEKDIDNETCSLPGEIVLPKGVKVDNPPCDYTPAKYITLLFTDLGVLTPSAVSDELIRLYQ